MVGPKLEVVPDQRPLLHAIRVDRIGEGAAKGNALDSKADLVRVTVGKLIALPNNIDVGAIVLEVGAGS